MFKNRVDAGKRLAKKLAHFKNPVILGVPRGGVVVAATVAKELKAKLSAIIVRKLPAPDNEELAIGAVAEDGTRILNAFLIRQIDVSRDYVEKETEVKMREIKKRMELYGIKTPSLRGRTVIIVDDGMATGSTMLAAIKFVLKHNAKSVIVAVPVASVDSINFVKDEAEVIVLEIPLDFRAVGEFYKEFEQVTDEEVKKLLS
ncbi:MAG TPA: phosphoribosyltransferase family protein [archaeon]|nr:phosphoribosyltransferase family protein [archaeon]